MKKLTLVIGSGPSGVSAAHALLNAGRRVALIDAGFRLDPERQRRLEVMRTSEKHEWSQAHNRWMKEGMEGGVAGVPLKLTFGSDFPYRVARKYIPIMLRGVDTAPSMALGGLSNVWGAAILPHRDVDIEDWPISSVDLESHYAAVSCFMATAGTKDRLASLFPFNNNVCSEPLMLSRQAEGFLADLERNHTTLEANGLYFGRSRLAVRSRSSDRETGCVYCGLCMYGCPIGAIFNSASALRSLLQYSNFSYINDLVVERVEERGEEVVILAKSIEDGRAVSLTGDRVYLAAGSLSTTRILLRSMEAYETPLYMHDSQYFIFPFLRYQGAGNVTKEALHTLSQAFIEIIDPKISPSTIHLQVYGYNDILERTAKSMLGPLRNLFKAPLMGMLSRMMIFQGYLHSRQSNRIRVELRRADNGAEPRLHLDATGAASVKEPINAVLKKLRRSRPYLRGVPLGALLRIAKPGRGFHSGGAFPMRSAPLGFESDTLGRPVGYNRVHAVDSTVLPTIPATTITFTAMANAHRIASAANEA